MKTPFALDGADGREIEIRTPGRADDLHLARATVDTDPYLKPNNAFYTEFPRPGRVRGLSGISPRSGLGNGGACPW